MHGINLIGPNVVAMLLVLACGTAAGARDLTEKLVGLPLEISWALVDSGCQPPPAKTMQCGKYGNFYVGSLAGLSCPIRASATEVPQGYPGGELRQMTPTTVPMAPTRWAPAGGILVKPKAGEPVPSEENEFALCDPGVVFGPPGGVSGAEPWLAALDFLDEHGSSVGYAMFDFSHLLVHLFALNDPGVEGLLGEAVSDAHVVAQLCGLLETIDDEGVVPPTVLNMSFGRLYDPLIDPTTKPCNRNTMSCQVVKLLTRLQNLHGVTSVAAAGNHQLQQFPAVIDKVLSVGSLDLTAFTASQQTISSWESPPAQLDFMGSALCLQCKSAAGSVVYWRPRPGSSYASATFAGGLATTLLASAGTLDPLTRAWQPTWSAQRGCFHLGPDLDVPCNPSVNRIFAQILGVGEVNCSSSLAQPPNLTLDVPESPDLEDPLVSLMSQSEHIHKHGPAPPPDICGSCVDDYDNKAAGLSARRTELTLDLSGASELPPSQVISKLVFRIGNEYYTLLDEILGDAEVLDQLRAGYYASLTLRFVPELPENEQTSLISITTQGAQEPYWNSTPVSIVPRPSF